MTRALSRKENGVNLLGFARLVTVLLDGPITAPGAAEALGLHEDTVEAQLRALEAADAARISRWRRNPHGRPTAIWDFNYWGPCKSEPYPTPMHPRKT